MKRLKRKHPERTKRIKLPPVKRLKKQLDFIFSIYTRLKYSHGGMVACFTCGRILPIKEMQNGHFQSRRFTNTRYNEINNQPQDYVCNCVNHGEQFKYGEMIDKTYGEGTAAGIERLARVSKKFTRGELAEMLDTYTNRVMQLLSEKSLSKWW